MGAADLRLAPVDRVEHLQLGAVQVRQHRHLGERHRSSIVERGEVVQVKQPHPREGLRCREQCRPDLGHALTLQR